MVDKHPQPVVLADLSVKELEHLLNVLNRAIDGQCKDCPEPVELVSKRDEVSAELNSRK